MSSLSNIDTHELVSSKENIQPLRRGRDTSILCAALQAVTDKDIQQELEKQRNEFEIKLRSNNSEDPLSDWCNYIHWIEQSFPKQGREGKLNVVLQKCINKFKDCERYMNDSRFVKICIKYADIEENTVELLSQIHRHGIGVSCAELYIAWAEKYAVDNCFKKANAIYERGFQCSAQPLELLKEAHQNFQAFLVRKMLNEGEIFQPTLLDSNPTEARQPYNMLQSVISGQKDVVPSIRVGSNVLGAAGKLQQIKSREPKLKNNMEIKVYEDAENKFSSAEPEAKIEKVHSKKTLTKENRIKPGVWTNKQNKNAPFTMETPAPLTFQVHRDEDTDESSQKPRGVPSSVLKSRKEKPNYEDEYFANVPLFYPEPYDPTKLSMYCKEQVYAGGLEFQFEELRAIQYRKKREAELNLKKMNAQKFAEPESPQVIASEPQSTLAYKSESHSKQKIEKKKLKPEDSVEKRKLGSIDQRRKTLFTNPLPVSEPLKNNYVPEQENLPSSEHSMNQTIQNQTIHTKEALSEMQQLWFSKPASPVPAVAIPNKPVGKSILKPSKPCFSLYVDESCLENFKASDKPDKPLDLSLRAGCSSPFEEVIQEKQVPSSSQKLNFQIFDKENVFAKTPVAPVKKVLSELEVDDEDKENNIPKDYCGPIGKSDRKVSGILTPAENVETAPLSDEEIEIEEDEGDGENEMGQDFSGIIQCNTTGITETWNFTKGFQFPRGESTPNVRKSLYNKEECNESVFVPHQNDNHREKVNKADPEFEEPNDKTIVLHSDEKKPTPTKVENFTKNLSVIAETSREYRSSSSGSSGASTLALRSSKNFPYTPCDGRSTKISMTSSHTTLLKTKVQSYTGYEASSEFSQTALKTPTANSEKHTLGTTFDLMKKLSAIESASISLDTKEEGEIDIANDKMKELEVTEKKDCEEKKVESIDPFSDEVITKLLEDVDFPKANHCSGYFLLLDTDLVVPKVGSTITLGANNFDVKKLLGEGSYAKVYRLSNSRNGEQMIGKYQKPAFPWEFYITREIQSRIQDDNLMKLFMDVESAYFFRNSSILLTRPVEFGDLLAVINKMKVGKMMSQSLAIYFTCQILNILETLHACKIIHGDVKPDNFLLRYVNTKPQLQLIDFGRSIDMSLFPEDTTFTKVVTTEGFTTIEMKLGKPWTYQIDLYGLANCGHCLLFGDYMKVENKNGVWNITKIIPRYWAKTEWKNFFVTLLNVESCWKLPSLVELRKSLEDVLEEDAEFEFSLFKLINLLKDR